MSTPIQLERELNKKLGDWLDDAESLRTFCVESGLSIPAIMLPIFGESPTKIIKSSPIQEAPFRQFRPNVIPRTPLARASISGMKAPAMPEYGERPSEAQDDWMAVPFESLSTANLILYIVKMNNGSASSRYINAQLTKLRPKTAASTGSMSLKMLVQEEKIIGDFREWIALVDVHMTRARDRMWCSGQLLRSTDRAALRREVIISALQINEPMTVSMIAECLRMCPWLKLPIDSNLIKADMRILNRDNLAVKEGTLWRIKE